MSIDLPRLKLEAANAVDRGRFRKAAELFIRLARLDGYEPKWWQSAGDAFRSDGTLDEALLSYLHALAGWAQRGELLKAILVARRVLEIDPTRADSPEQLASRYAHRDAAPPPLRQHHSPTALFDLKRLRFELDGHWYNNEGKPCPEPILIYPRAGMLPVPLKRPGTKRRRTGEIFDAEAPPIVPPIVLPVAPPPMVVPRIASAPPVARPPRTLPAPSVTPPESNVRRLDLPRLAAGPPPPGAPIARAPIAPTGNVPRARPSLPPIPLFASLDEARRTRFIERARRIERGAGAEIVRQGERGASLFVVLRGKAVVLDVAGARIVGRHREGDLFGERSLFTGLPRRETITAGGPTTLLELDRPLVGELVRDAIEAGQWLRRRFRDGLVAEVAPTSALLGRRDPIELRALVERFRFLELDAGTALIHEGYPPAGLFVLLCGQCDVIRRPTGSRIDTLQPGDSAGGAALLNRVASPATVQTRARAWLLGLPLSDLDALLGAHPDLRALLEAQPN